MPAYFKDRHTLFNYCWTPFIEVCRCYGRLDHRFDSTRVRTCDAQTPTIPYKPHSHKLETGALLIWPYDKTIRFVEITATHHRPPYGGRSICDLSITHHQVTIFSNTRDAMATSVADKSGIQIPVESNHFKIDTCCYLPLALGINGRARSC